MVLALYFFVSWVVSIIFLKMPKSLSFMQNSFVFLVILIISMNWSWIIYQELTFIRLSSDAINFTSFLINRSIAVPCIIAITVNLIHLSKSLVQSLLFTLASTIFLSLSALGGIYFKVTEYVHWHFVYDVFYFLLLNIVGYILFKLFYILGHKEVGINDLME